MVRASVRAFRSAPGLPPLPPPVSWKGYFPSRQLSAPPDMLCREFPGRVLLANPELCDDLVRALNLREDEVVLEYNPGPGQLTRSLLAGGIKEARKWDDDRLLQAKEISATVPDPAEAEGSPSSGSATGSSGKVKAAAKSAARASKKEPWPPWARTLSEIGYPGASESSGSSQSEEREAPTKPRLVVGVEPSAAMLNLGFNCPAQRATFLSNPQSSSMVSEAKPNTVAKDEASTSDPTRGEHREMPITTSHYEPRLVLSHGTAYKWPVLPAVLSHPLVSSHLPVFDDSKPSDAEKRQRPWTADAPPITLVAQIPDAVNGEQMVSQWVGSAVGSLTERNWIWQWGRIRMALILGKGLYDRMTALPGEVINTKLSIMTRALFDITPLPPYHHVPNVDRGSKLTEGRPLRNYTSAYYVHKWGTQEPTKLAPLNYRSAKEREESEVDHPWANYPRTHTVQSDFYPMLARRRLSAEAHNVTPLERPRLLGLLLEPKRDSYVRMEQKEAWDFVLRNCFVQMASPLRESLKNLGFNGEGLADKIADPSTKYRGQPVDPMKTVRELDIAEWARVVDVFDRWPFRPENLLIAASSVHDDLTREIGQD